MTDIQRRRVEDLEASQPPRKQQVIEYIFEAGNAEQEAERKRQAIEEWEREHGQGLCEDDAFYIAIEIFPGRQAAGEEKDDPDPDENEGTGEPGTP